MNELTRSSTTCDEALIPAPANSTTPWPEPSLSAELRGMVYEAKRASLQFLPIIDASMADHIHRLARHFEVGLSGANEEQIETLIFQLSVLYPSAKLTAKEAALRLDLYVELLGDVPFDVLQRAMRQIAKTSRFFPTVAEIREAAESDGTWTSRRDTLGGLRNLLLRYEMEADPAITMGEAMRRWQRPSRAQEMISPC